MYRLSILALSFSLILFSCNNDDGNDSENQQANFFALTVGNTWEYEVSRYSNIIEEYELQDLVITNRISAETVVDGETFYTFTTTSEGNDTCQLCLDDIGNEMVRDSLGYLINADGDILFSNTATEDYLLSSNTFGDIYGKFVNNNVNVNTPAGEFTAHQNDRYVIRPDGELAPGTDSHLISESIGTVQKTISLISEPIPLYKITLKSYSLVGGE